ncbi:MAG: glycosyltransferase [Acidimicrobiales bacterium]
MSPALHGILVTYRRHDDLARYLDVLRGQTVRLERLVVVDNEASPVVADLVRAAADVAERVDHLLMPENTGPAGAIAAGMGELLTTAGDDEWMFLLDDDDPPVRDDTLAAIAAVAADLTARGDDCGAVGAWGARLDRWTGRLRFVPDTDPVEVDYVSGNSLPLYRVGALRRVGVGPAELFFGFDDLELGLRLRAGGFTVWSAGLAAVHGLGGSARPGRVSGRVTPPTWRRYYSLRNLVWIYRRYGLVVPALFVSVTAGLLKPLVNLPFSPRVAGRSLRQNMSALRDGWSGRLGRSVDPGPVR